MVYGTPPFSLPLNLYLELSYKGAIPDQDVREDSAQGQGPPPSAPPLLSDMDHLQGYENTQFEAGEFEEKSGMYVCILNCDHKLA